MAIFKLGSEAQDKSSGLKGFLVGRAETIGGNTQYAIQPQMGEDETDPKKGTWVDYHHITVLGEGFSATLPEPAPHEVIMGKEYKDKLTSFKGIASEVTFFANGCAHITLTVPNKVNDDGRTITDSFEYQRLELVGEGVLKKLQKALAPAEAKQDAKQAEERSVPSGTGRGGPSRPMLYRKL